MKRISRSVAVCALFFLPLLLSGCGAPGLDPSTEAGRQAIYDATNIALTNGDCTDALSYISPLYNSVYSNNYARLLYSSAQGCVAKIDYFPFLDSLVNVTITSGGVWTALTTLFPYSDYAGVYAGWQGMAALEASLTNPASVSSTYEFNTSTNNVASYNATDRTDESNMYLFVMAMSVIGRTQYRNGAPNSGGHKTQNLPWGTAATMTQEGCEYAAAILNMIDGIDQTAAAASSATKTVLQLISSTYKTTLSSACEVGCTTTALTGCSFSAGECTASGSFCPLALRNGAACTALVTDQASCAAAGIVNFINTNAVLGWN